MHAINYRNRYDTFLQNSHLAQILDQSHALLIVLDRDRRLIYCTQGVADLVHAPSVLDILGKRPGEFLRCVNALDQACGESEFCCDCGALLGIRSALGDHFAETECSLTLDVGGRHETRFFAMRSMPLECQGESLVVLSLQDVGHEKRRRALEQVFLHDILNTVGALRGILHFLRSDLSGPNKELLESVLPYFDLCVDEIAAQQKLLAAENNELVPSQDRFSLGQLLQGMANIFRQHALGNSKTIVVDLASADDDVVTDRTIFHRVCMNLLKNALEATSSGGTVRIAGEVTNDYCQVSISNPGCMPPEIQRSLFHRAFSTKGSGRGLGTYSVHLFCTQYLKGRVWFESDENHGTVFHVRIPQGQQTTLG